MEKNNTSSYEERLRLITNYRKSIEIQERQLTEMKNLIDKSVDYYLKHSALLELAKTKLKDYQRNFDSMKK